MMGLLNISEAMSIALHTCVWLANGVEGFSSAGRISKTLGFSANHSAKVVQQLVRAGLLETERGPSGGARLAKPASKITLLDIYVATGGSPDFSGCLLKHSVCKGDGCLLGKTLREQNTQLVALLKRTRLDSVVGSMKKNRTAN
jgi:Rrf2 family nitric oxide-sensitive transcriptional repressor